MSRAFDEIQRVLKLNAWATVVFQSSDAEVWAALRAAVEEAGFDLASATYLDKGQQSHKGYKGRSGSEDVASFDVVLNLHKPGKTRRRAGPPGGLDDASDLLRRHLERLDPLGSNLEHDRRRTLPFLHSLLVQAHFNGSIGLEIGEYALVRRICEKQFACDEDGRWRLRDAEPARRSTVPGLPKSTLNRAILDALGDSVESHGEEDRFPFPLKVKGVVSLAVFAFTITSPPGGRHPLESKIQLIAPGQGKGERGNLKPGEGFPVLLGYKAEETLFVLWDAYKQVDFSYSKNVQVRAAPLQDALSLGIGRTTRKLSSGEETVIAARPDHLRQALAERVVSNA